MTVADAKGRRWDAATGIGFAIFSIVALALPGTPPKADDPTSKIASFLGDHRKEVLVGNFLFGIAAIFFIWWVGTLRSYLRSGEGGEGRLSAAAFGGGIAGVVLLLAGASLFNGVTFELIKGQRASPELVRAIFDAASGVIAMASFAFAAFFGAAACSGARSGALPPWAYWSASVVAVIQVVAGLALFVTSGAFATGGAVPGFVAPAVALLWVVAVSVLMMMRHAVPPVARAEP